MINPLEKKVRKLYNSNKPIVCCPESLEQFKAGESESLKLKVNSEWIEYTPKSKNQSHKAMYYKQYNLERI